jgi:hypothetical protein
MPKHTVQLDVPKDVKGKAKQDYLATAQAFLRNVMPARGSASGCALNTNCHGPRQSSFRSRLCTMCWV